MWLRGAVEGGTPDLSALRDYGALGFLVALLVGLVAVLLRRERDRSDRESARADRAEAENRRLHELIQETQERLIPIVVSATEALRESTEVFRSIHAQWAERAHSRREPR